MQIDEYTRQYESCTLCPRNCGVNRNEGEKGVCGETSEIRLASAVIHFGEEPPISGASGSGTVFFSGCGLRCAFCQNRQISHEGMGKAVSVDELALIFLAIERMGARNLNLVSATHFAPGIMLAVSEAKKRGFGVPLVWNSSGYESLATIDSISGYVDIWLPDMKTHDEKLAYRLFGAADYPQKNRQALSYMAKHCETRWNGDTMESGIIARHLILPGNLKSTEAVLRWFKSELYGKAMLSLMCQYIPMDFKNGSTAELDGLETFVTKEESCDCLFLLEELGIQEGFIQEETDDSAWRPDFSRINPFPERFAKPVWHYTTGFCV